MNLKALRRLLAHSTLLMGARLAGAGLSFIGTILIARLFGADALGTIAIAGALTGLMALFAAAGRPAVAVMFVSEYQTGKKQRLIRGFVDSSYKMLALISILITSLAAVYLGLFSDSLPFETMLAIVFACASAPALAKINLNCGVLTGFRRQMIALIPDLMVKPLIFLGGIVGISLLAPENAIVWLLAASTLAVWLTCGVQHVLGKRAANIEAKKADMSDEGRWREKATPWIAIILLSDYLVELHLLLAGFLVKPAMLAILHVCFRMRMLASFGMRALYAFIMPDVYTSHARKDMEQLSRELTTGNALVLAYVLAVCTGIYFLGDLFLSMFGEEFRSGWNILLISCFTMIPRAICGPTTAVMAAAGRQISMIAMLIIGIILSVITIFVVYPDAGIESIAIGYAVAITFSSLAQWFWVYKETRIDCSVFSYFTYNYTLGDKQHGFG